MLYAIMGTDIADSSDKRSQTRPRHLAHLQPLIDAGRVILAGPHPAIDSPEPGPAGMTGSLIVAEFDSLDEAMAWAESDPYAREGVFETVKVKPILQVYP